MKVTFKHIYLDLIWLSDGVSLKRNHYCRNKCSKLIKLKKVIKENCLIMKNSLNDQVKSYWSIRNELTEINELILKGHSKSFKARNTELISLRTFRTRKNNVEN